MRVAVLPRELASRVITSALARAFAAINVTSLVLTVPMLIAFMVERGQADALPVPLVILATLIAIATLAAIKPNRIWLATFLVVGTIGATVFQIVLLAAYPAMQVEGLYILNRPAVALVLVGVTASTVRQGFAWSLVGFALSNVATFVAAMVVGLPFVSGYGAFFSLIATSLAYGALAAIQARLRRRVPDFDAFEEQTRRMALAENLRARVTAAVHDTLLNDLSLVMNAPETLDERMKERLRLDVRTLTSAEWLTESAEVVIDDQDSVLRNKIMQMISELQWRGLTVHITGSGSRIIRLPDHVPDIIVDVLRACLENVLRHSGTDIAELDLGATPGVISIVVTDNGSGFDPSTIAEDRLGLRASVIDRIRSIGGTVRIWSTPGEGTSIVMEVPIQEFVLPDEEPSHGRA